MAPERMATGDMYEPFRLRLRVHQPTIDKRFRRNGDAMRLDLEVEVRGAA
jgi:hypothetical protein